LLNLSEKAFFSNMTAARAQVRAFNAENAEFAEVRRHITNPRALGVLCVKNALFYGCRAALTTACARLIGLAPEMIHRRLITIFGGKNSSQEGGNQNP
jgi:hypothetical protein